MAGHYHGFPQYPPYYSSSNTPPLMQPETFAPRLQHLQTLSTESLNQGYAEFDEAGRPMLPAQGAVRVRRRTVAGGEPVKHRRTRSGCYTCRNRRVKCDETHPICERCRKGNRECVYPEPPSSSKSARKDSKSKPARQDSVSSGDGDDAEGERKGSLPPIPDEEESPVAESSGFQRQSSFPFPSDSRRGSSATPSLTNDKSPSPSTEGSASLVNHRRPSVARKNSRSTIKTANRSWQDLPPSLRFYLDYYRHNITHHHYAFKHDGADFMRTNFLEIAIRNEPLLYAVVGFAAYHHTLTKHGGKIQDFLVYYNKSVEKLRESIQRDTKPTVATLLTILQLATFEEYLGDWVNLLGHQKAAYQIVTTLYTPQTIMQNETLRKIICWYVRFDLFAGIMSGYETVLSREWFVATHEYYVDQVRNKPHDISVKLDERFAFGRLLATDIAVLFAKKGRGQIADEEFSTEYAELVRRLGSWRSDLHPSLLDTNKRVTNFSAIPTRDIQGDRGPFNPEFIYTDDLFSINISLMDICATEVMLISQLATSQDQAPPPEILAKASEVCRIFQAMEDHPDTPPGALIDAQASLGMAMLFVQKDERTNMWCRRKLAKVESLGYIFPRTYRYKMSEAWDADLSHWWLPNDEGFPPLIRSMREFIEDRTGQPRDQTAEDVRDMKGLFSAMVLKSSPQNSPSSEESRDKPLNTKPFGMDPGYQMSMDHHQEALIYDGSPQFSWNYEQDQFGAQ